MPRYGSELFLWERYVHTDMVIFPIVNDMAATRTILASMYPIRHLASSWPFLDGIITPNTRDQRFKYTTSKTHSNESYNTEFKRCSQKLKSFWVGMNFCESGGCLIQMQSLHHCHLRNAMDWTWVHKTTTIRCVSKRLCRLVDFT